MRLVSILNGVDLNYDDFSFKLHKHNDSVDLIAYCNHNPNKATMCTIENVKDAEQLMKDIVQAYEKGTKVYFIST